MKKLFVLLFSSILVLSMLFVSGAAEAKDTKPPKTLTVKRITTETIYVKGKTEGKATVEVRVGKILLGKATAINKGDFKVKIKAQKKGTKLIVIAKDKARNAKKATVTVYGVPKAEPKPEPKPELKPLNVSKTVEKDGIRFDVTFSTDDFKPKGELKVKVKATNISNEAIPFIKNGCDRGINAAIFTEDMNGQVFEGSIKPDGMACATQIKPASLDPNESMVYTEGFYLPTNGLNDHLYANVTFSKRLDYMDPVEPIEVQMDIKEELKPLTISKTAEKNGIKFDVTFSSKDFKPNGELNVKVKATNISDEDIPYVGFNGCDRGINVSIFTKDINGHMFKGNIKPSDVLCNLQVSDYSLAPGESTEDTQVFILPTKGLNDHVYANVTFKNKTDVSSPVEPIEVQIDIKE